jgi:hypothetical protein
VRQGREERARNESTYDCAQSAMKGGKVGDEGEGQKVQRRGALAPPPNDPSGLLQKLFADPCSVSLHRVDVLPARTKLRPVVSTEARRPKLIPPQNAELGVVRNYCTSA